MLAPIKPPDECARLAELTSLGLLDTQPEERFDRITRTARRLFGVATALVSLVDAERQWFKSAQGLDARETARDISFCGHTILADDAFIIEDAALDARFADNPLVRGAPHIRFYAGMPLHGPHGHRIGTLCLIDPAPRRFDAADLTALGDLAMLAEVQCHTRQLNQDMLLAHANAARLRAIFDNVVDGILTIDEAGIVEAINPAAERIFGYGAEEVLGQNIKMLMPEPYHGEHDDYLRRYRADGLARVVGAGREVRGRRKDGGVFPLELAVSEMSIDGRRAFSGIVRDISERRRLEHLQAQFSAIIANSTDAIMSKTLDGLVTSWNPAAEQMFGFNAAEMMGRPMALLLPPGYADEEERILARIGFGEHIAHFETLRRNKSGAVFPVSVTISPVRDERGVVVGASKIARDISERKRVELALLTANGELAASTQLQRAILNSANFSMIATDVNGLVTMFSAGAERMLGYADAELVGRHTPALIHDPDEMLRRAAALGDELGRVIEPGFETFVAKAREGLAHESEWTYVRKDGCRLPVMLSVTALRDESGELTGFLGIAYDLTERKKVERMKHEFISTVSHELRTPLTSIRGSLGLLVAGMAGAIAPSALPLLEIANNNCERLVRLINDILDIEKIESGNMRFDLRGQSVLALVRQAVEATGAYAAGLGVTLALQADDDGDDYLAPLDADRLTQVIVNLLSNAAKFSPAGAVVKVGVGREGNAIRVTVRDQGPGIDEQFQGRIFEKFAQADSSDTRQKGGTGLGLSISKAIIEKHHGRIGFHSTPGAGAEFYIELPAAPAPLPAAAPSAGQGRILICEDDPDIAKLIGNMLWQGGWSSDIAGNAAQARALLDSGDYAAMTLDLSLPGEDGLSLLTTMRADAKSASLPVVVVSAKADDGDGGLRGGAVGVIDWLTKPIDEAKLRQALRKATRCGDGAAPSVLYIEDDPDLAQVVSILLAPMLAVTHAGNLAEALAALAARRFGLIILDLNLPDGNGADLLANLPEINADTPLMIFSGEEPGRAMRDRVALALIKSRTSNEQLLTTIHNLIGRLRARDPVKEE